MTKKSGWVAPKDPVYGKGGVVDSVTNFLPNVVGGIAGAMGVGKKNSAKTDARKKALKKMAGK